MNRQDVGKLVAVCIAMWPNHPADNIDVLVTGWEMALGDVPYDVAHQALAVYLREGRFFPAPSEIRKLAVDAITELPSGGDAWRMVLARMRATYPGHPAPSWEAPKPVKDAVQAMGGMHVLRMSEMPGADEARFLAIYASYREREARDADLPAIWTAKGRAAIADGEDGGLAIGDGRAAAD